MRDMISAMTIGEAINALKGGGVGVMPTDTVYGLVAAATDRKAVERLYELKRREQKPGTLIAASVDDLAELGLDRNDLQLASKLWPASLCVIVGAGEELRYLHQGVGSLAVRIPADDKMRSFLMKTGPLATSSANQPGEPPAINVNEAWNYFGETADFYVDGGDLSGREPSTIIRMRDGEIEVLREGAVKRADLRR